MLARVALAAALLPPAILCLVGFSEIWRCRRP